MRRRCLKQYIFLSFEDGKCEAHSEVFKKSSKDNISFYLYGCQKLIASAAIGRSVTGTSNSSSM